MANFKYGESVDEKAVVDKVVTTTIIEDTIENLEALLAEMPFSMENNYISNEHTVLKQLYLPVVMFLDSKVTEGTFLQDIEGNGIFGTVLYCHPNDEVALAQILVNVRIPFVVFPERAKFTVHYSFEEYHRVFFPSNSKE